MTERPILMSAPMVRAILDGRKTQTRRIVKPQPRDHDHLAYSEADWKNEKPEYITTESINAWFCKYCGEGIRMMDGKPMYKCPYGNPGDILWVRETFQIVPPNMVFYKADTENKAKTGWKSPIFMPKVASRIRLEVTGVRAERLNEITEDDAIAEGIEHARFESKIFKSFNGYKNYDIEDYEDGTCFKSPIDSYESLWRSINGSGSWELNPWVWVVTFKNSEGEHVT